MLPDRLATGDIVDKQLGALVEMTNISIAAIDKAFPAPLSIFIDEKGNFDATGARAMVASGEVGEEDMESIKARADAGDPMAIEFLAKKNLSGESTSKKPAPTGMFE